MGQRPQCLYRYLYRRAVFFLSFLSLDPTRGNGLTAFRGQEMAKERASDLCHRHRHFHETSPQKIQNREKQLPALLCVFWGG